MRSKMSSTMNGTERNIPIHYESSPAPARAPSQPQSQPQSKPQSKPQSPPQHQPQPPTQTQPQPQPQPIKFEVPPESRKNSIAQIGDKLVGMLDEIERRVENLRETAALMEQEKESLMEMLQTVNMNKDMLRLGPSEKDDIDATTNRLIVRCKTVNVSVVTPRNPEQEKALDAVNLQMEELVKRMEQDLAMCKQVRPRDTRQQDQLALTCKRYLNACAIDQPDGPIDQKFQSHVIGCTAEDQKKIRKRLEQLVTLITRSEQTVAQAHQ